MNYIRFSILTSCIAAFGIVSAVGQRTNSVPTKPRVVITADPELDDNNTPDSRDALLDGFRSRRTCLPGVYLPLEGRWKGYDAVSSGVGCGPRQDVPGWLHQLPLALPGQGGVHRPYRRCLCQELPEPKGPQPELSGSRQIEVQD